MLTNTQIENNKQKFKDLVADISRLDESRLANLLGYLDSTDFFSAPASAKYHGAYDGGLCEHSLNVYENLVKLYNTFKFKLEANDIDSLKIVALFHDAAKINFYTKEIKHKKVYDQNGSSHWEDYIGYTYKEDSLVVGNHEETCAYITSSLIPLRVSEYAAILNHHGGMGWDSAKAGCAKVFQEYPIAHFLHIADCIDAYHLNN